MERLKEKRKKSLIFFILHRARNWNSAGMRIRPPRSPEPSASRASNLDGVEGRPLPYLSHLQMSVAATVLEGGCQEPSGRIHENSATGYIVAERPFLKLLTVWLSSPIHPLPTTKSERSTAVWQCRVTICWVEGREFSHPRNWHLVLYLQIFKTRGLRTHLLLMPNVRQYRRF